MVSVDAAASDCHLPCIAVLLPVPCLRGSPEPGLLTWLFLDCLAPCLRLVCGRSGGREGGRGGEGRGRGEGRSQERPSGAIWEGGLDGAARPWRGLGTPPPRPHLLRAAPSVRRGGEPCGAPPAAAAAARRAARLAAPRPLRTRWVSPDSFPWTVASPPPRGQSPRQRPAEPAGGRGAGAAPAPRSRGDPGAAHPAHRLARPAQGSPGR